MTPCARAATPLAGAPGAACTRQVHPMLHAHVMYAPELHVLYAPGAPCAPATRGRSLDDLLPPLLLPPLLGARVAACRARPHATRAPLPLLGEAKRRLGGAPSVRPWPLGTQGSGSGNAGRWVWERRALGLGRARQSGGVPPPLRHQRQHAVLQFARAHADTRSDSRMSRMALGLILRL